MKRNYWFLLLLWSVSSVFLTGCEDEKEEPDFISEIASEFLFDQHGKTQTISFTTNKAWTATLSPRDTWCGISPVSGEAGKATIKVNVNENKDYTDRAVTLSIKAGDIEKRVTITQTQKDAILLSKDKYKIPEETGTFEVEVEANVGFKAIIPGEAKWIRQKESPTKALGKKKIIFEVDQNEDIENRQTTILLESEKNNASAEIFVEQLTANPIRKIHLEKESTLLDRLGSSFKEIEELTISGKMLVNELHLILTWANDLHYLNLSEVVITNGATVYNRIIGDLFTKATNLKTLILPKSITEIAARAFYSCEKLTSITLQKGITSIGNAAFYQCKALTSITIPDGVISIGEEAFYGCTSLTSINIPNSVTTIEAYTFDGCISLASINIPNSVTTIGEYAFASCQSITSITIPNSVTIIEFSTFSYCKELISITIGSGVESIDPFAFEYCNNVTEIHIKATTPPSTSRWHQLDTTTIILYVPTGRKEAYQNHIVWEDFKEYREE